MSTRIVRSACRMCHGTCQVLVHLDGDRVVKISGDRDSPVSRGHVCPKGLASPELLYHPDRVTRPLRRVGKRGEDRWEAISWDQALTEMAARLSGIRAEHGAEAFALTQGTGRPYTDLTARFANAFGTPNYTGVAHNCFVPRAMASAFTTGTVMPPGPDYRGEGGVRPRCLVLWGTNLPGIGGAHGVCGGTVARAAAEAEVLVVIDPRRTRSAARATHWLQLRPGTDGALALAWIHLIIAESLWDREFVEHQVHGFAELRAHVAGFSPEWAAGITGLPAEAIRAAARAYATTRPAAIQWGSALDMSACSFQTARSIMILRALTGNLDRPGGDVVAVPPEGLRFKSQFLNPEMTGKLLLPLGQAGRALDSLPDPAPPLRRWLAARAFGLLDAIKRRAYRRVVARAAGRPVASQLRLFQNLRRARYPLCAVTHPPTFWKALASGLPYQVRALWVMGANPLLTAASPLVVETGLRRLDYLVVSDFFLTPTARLADLVLPAATWLEQEDVVNYMKLWCVLARPRLAQVGEVRDDREVMIDLARRLGHADAFPWPSWRAFLDETLAGTGLDFGAFCQKGILRGEMRYEKWRSGGFGTPTGKVEFHSQTLAAMGVSPLPVYREPPSSARSRPDLAADYPLTLTTGARLRGYFHSEGRQLPSLRRLHPEPEAEFHPELAGPLGIAAGAWIRIETPSGSVRMKARLTDAIAPDVVSAPHGWWFPEAPGQGWMRSNVNLLFGEQPCDPDVGSEPLRSTLCRVRLDQAQARPEAT